MALIIDTSDSPTLPLSPEQRAIDASAVHVMAVALDARGAALPADTLRDAVHAAARLHQVLRHAFGEVAGLRGTRQRFEPHAPACEWVEADLGKPGSQPLAEWLEGFRSQPLDAARGETLRAARVQATGEGTLLVVAVRAQVADRHSLRILARAIEAAVQDPVASPDEVFEYGQFVQWRQALLEDDAEGESRAYWQGFIRRAGDAQAPRLPSRRMPPPPEAGEQGRDRFVRAATPVLPLQPRLLDRVRHLASRHELPPASVLRAAWWILLARLSGTTRFACGWQHDCRADYEPMQGGIGVYDKVLPWLTDLPAQASFADVLTAQAQVEAAHLSHQEGWSLDDASPEVPADGTTSIGIAVSPALPSAGAWPARILPGPSARFELALTIDQDADKAEARIHHDPSLYGDATVRRILAQYETLLTAAVDGPEQAWQALTLMNAEETAARSAWEEGRRVAAMHPGDAQPADEEAGIPARIAGWAARTPDASALEDGALKLNWRELDRLSATLARGLARHGVPRGGIVAIELPRGADMVIGMLAAWRVGAAFLPIEPGWPEARRQAVIDDARPACVIDEGNLPTLHALGETAASPADGAPAEPLPGDLAYVLYTSGSTGRPKGVRIGHAQLLNYVRAASEAMALGASRRWALTSTVAADLGYTALFGALFNGACLVIASPRDMRDGEAFSRFMVQRRIDGLKIVPSHLDALLECGSPRLPARLILGGEAAPRELIERIRRIAPECALFNHYGPTEATVGVMVHALPPDAPVPDALPLTRVLAGNRVRVLGPDLRPVPAGAAGMLYIGGAQLCLGYLNRPDLDAPGEGVFIADPAQPDERLYRTGDLACVLADGGLKLLGRQDDQVKVRGFRVETGEIEAALTALEGVRQAVVLPRRRDATQGHAGETLLEAFVVPSGAASSDASSGASSLPWREALARVLPDHMVPSRWTVLPALPRLANGKVDRIALAALEAAPESTGLASMTSLVPAAHEGTPPIPADATTATIADTMAAVLGKPSVGAADDFFDLGGHSLLVIKLVARLRKALNVEIEPATVFDHPTAQALAAFLRPDAPATDPA